MAIPECIRLVCRPKNTVVVKMGNLYAVRTVIPMSERKNKNTKLGSVIGYIINLKYVPIEKIYVKKEQKYPYMVSFAREVLLLSVGYDTLLNLFETFNIEVAMQIFIISCLKVIHPGVTERDINGYYKNSYLSVLFPDVHLSKNIVSNIYSYIGNDFKSCSDYKKKILDVVSLSDVIYIDGTYEQYNSFRNSLSKTPIKNKYKGYEQFLTEVLQLKPDEYPISINGHYYHVYSDFGVKFGFKDLAPKEAEEYFSYTAKAELLYAERKELYNKFQECLDVALRSCTSVDGLYKRFPVLKDTLDKCFEDVNEEIANASD